MDDCPRCLSARSFAFGICQVCLAEVRIVDTSPALRARDVEHAHGGGDVVVLDEVRARAAVPDIIA